MGLILVGLLCLQSPPEGNTAEATISALRAGWQQWRQDVVFRATYRLRRGYATTIEGALQHGIETTVSPSGSVGYEASGGFCKDGKEVRFSVHFDNPPLVLDDEKKKNLGLKGGQRIVTRSSFDEVSNDDFEVRYNPSTSGDYANVSRRKPGQKGFGVYSVGWINPLYPYANPNFDPFELLSIDPASNMAMVSKEVTSNSDEYVDVVLRQKAKWNQKRRVRFWTKQSPPVVTEIDETITNPDGKTTELRIVLSAFQACPGGMVARRIVSASKDREGLITVKEWQSKDLGDKLPSDQDFVIEVAQSTVIGGLKKPPPTDGHRRTINIRDISEDALGQVEPGADPTRPLVSSGMGVLFWLINAIIAGGLGLGILGWSYRRRVRARS